MSFFLGFFWIYWGWIFNGLVITERPAGARLNKSYIPASRNLSWDKINWLMLGVQFRDTKTFRSRMFVCVRLIYVLKSDNLSKWIQVYPVSNSTDINIRQIFCASLNKIPVSNDEILYTILLFYETKFSRHCLWIAENGSYIPKYLWDVVLRFMRIAIFQSTHLNTILKIWVKERK